MTKPECGILAGEPEIIGTRCMDGGTCHHACTVEEGCFRKKCCGPLTLSGLTDQWTAPAPPGPDLVEQLYVASSACSKYHSDYMGKVMPDDVYERFARLRDETIPRLKAELRAALKG